MNAPTTPDQLVCTQEAARAVGLDVAPSSEELRVMAESIVSMWGDRWAEPEDLAASTADAGAQLARAVPLVLAELDRLRGSVTYHQDRADRLSRQVAAVRRERSEAEAERNALRARVAELETSTAPRLCACGHSRHAHTAPVPHSCLAFGRTCPCPTYRQLPPDKAWEQLKRNIAVSEARAAEAVVPPCARCNGTAIDPEDSHPAEGPSHYSMGEPPVLEPCRDCSYGLGATTT